jgi:monofunctional biosynthetic peptidoglycan transglycosylase
MYKMQLRRWFFLFSSFITLIVGILIYILLTNPSVANIDSCLTTKMYSVSLCPQNAKYVKLRNVSKIFKHAIIISEDGAFYQHQGFDWEELKKSFYTNLAQQKFARGGSTITQQLVKNVYLTQEKSLLRKFREAILAGQIEALLTKDKILEKYVNVVEFGPNIFGIKAAAAHYFSKTPSELNVLESIYLAYLLPNPKLYSATHRKKQLTRYAKKRISELAYRMYRYKVIKESQYQHALVVIDQFPWNNLSAASINILNGHTDQLQNVDYAPDPNIPEREETDSEEDEVSSPAPKPIDESHSPEPETTESKTSSENANSSIEKATEEQPFDN